MADNSFRLNRNGIAEILKTEFTGQINQLADDVAAGARSIVGNDIDVEVEHYTTDRGAASVTIADAKGLELQATDGALTRAAAAVGLEVKVK